MSGNLQVRTVSRRPWRWDIQFGNMTAACLQADDPVAGIMLVTGTVHQPLSERTQRTLSRTVIARLLEAAAEDAATELHWLVPDTEALLTADILASHRFHRMAQIQAWSPPRLSAGIGAPPEEPHKLHDLLGRRREPHLTGLLSDCLTDSRDLPHLVTDPDQLIARWSRLGNADVLISDTRPQPAGIAVLHRDHDARSAVLQYVGVRWQHRRQGIGRSLLLRSCQLAAADAHIDDLTAWCDCTNTPGIRLYRSMGWLSGPVCGLWCRSVLRTDSAEAR